MLKTGGILFVGFPMGRDMVSMSHRIYGKYRLQLFLHMWEPIDIVNNRILYEDKYLGEYNNQPVLVLKKTRHDHVTPDRLRKN